MKKYEDRQCIAFEGHRCVAKGAMLEVARRVKMLIERGEAAWVLIFDTSSSQQIEIDFRGTVEEVENRLKQDRIDGPDASGSGKTGDGESRGPGRPKLGVVSREVSLLPRHWEWLSGQGGSASAALRRLVDEARKANRDRDSIRQSQNAAYAFMQAIAGDLPGYEEAIRALYAGDRERFGSCISEWPIDIRDHAALLAENALA